MIILASGDWHVHNYPEFAKPWREGLNTRARDIAWALGAIPKLITKYRVRVFCHLGDWNVNASNDYRIVNLTRELSMACAVAVRQQGGVMISLPGNHDTVSASADSHNNYPYLQEQNRITELGGVRFYAVGYNDPLPELTSLDCSAPLSVFLIHKDLEGGRTAQGFVYRSEASVGAGYFRAVKEALKDKVLFLAGHYHHPQRLGPVEVVGAPVQHNRGDIGDKRGVLLLDTQTLAIKRIALAGPQFHEALWKDEPFLEFTCPCCAPLGVQDRVYTERDYITLYVERDDGAYREAKQWAKESGLNVVVSMQKKKPLTEEKREVALSITNEEELLVRYLTEKEKLNRKAAGELVKLANQI